MFYVHMFHVYIKCFKMFYVGSKLVLLTVCFKSKIFLKLLLRLKKVRLGCNKSSARVLGIKEASQNAHARWKRNFDIYTLVIHVCFLLQALTQFQRIPLNCMPSIVKATKWAGESESYWEISFFTNNGFCYNLTLFGNPMFQNI